MHINCSLIFIFFNKNKLRIIIWILIKLIKIASAFFIRLFNYLLGCGNKILQLFWFYRQLRYDHHLVIRNRHLGQSVGNL